MVDDLIERWCAQHNLASLELVVAHTHGHNDHTGGDAQFRGRPDTVVVAKDEPSVREYFGLCGVEPATFNLGDRELVVASAPGHDPRSIVVVDPARGIMFSGDVAYPGRLYVDDLAALRDTLERLVLLAEEHGVSTVLGCHIERDEQGNDFPVGSNRHPRERPLPLSVDDLRALRTLAAGTTKHKGVVDGDPMSLYLGRCTWPMLRMAARTLVLRAKGQG